MSFGLKILYSVRNNTKTSHNGNLKTVNFIGVVSTNAFNIIVGQDGMESAASIKQAIFIGYLYRSLIQNKWKG